MYINFNLSLLSAFLMFKPYIYGYTPSKEVITMNANAELLNFIYQNSQMGTTTIPQIMEIVKDANFKAHLHAQLRQYEVINTEAKSLLDKNGYDIEGVGGFQKLSSYIMINLQTIKDHSNSHLAEMLIHGSNMGIIDAVKNLHKYSQDASSNVLALMRDLERLERNNIERLKPYL